MQINVKRWIYTRRPKAMVGNDHFTLVEEKERVSLSQGEILVENRYFSVDPYMRIQQSGLASWEPPHPLNVIQQGGIVGQVLQSNSPLYAQGDWVCGYSGWETHSVFHQQALSLLDIDDVPVTTALGVLGMPGRTAWFGLMEAGQPKPGETVVVSGAAGAVGSLVVQFAKKAGCRVVAFAGSQQKCQWLSNTLGADITLNYRDVSDYRQLQLRLDEHNIRADVYFDNVGGLISDAIFTRLNKRARVVICGQMSQYNGQLDNVEPGPRFLHHILYQRATIKGILARDYTHRMDEMVTQVRPWIKDNSLVFEEARVQGFDALPHHLASLFTRESVGKLIVEV